MGNYRGTLIGIEPGTRLVQSRKQSPGRTFMQARRGVSRCASRFSDLSLSTIRAIVHLQEHGVVPAHWDQMLAPITPQEQEQAAKITAYLLNYQLNLMNEATIWSRAIYPLLMSAETGRVQAWAQVVLKASYPHFELEGIADGVLGDAVSGMIDTPYLIVVEAKRGLEAQNPQYQLYGSMLAAAWQNQQRTPGERQEVYGCYTIGDNWTFVYGITGGFEAEMPSLTVLYSREYAERLEATTILRILKSIVRRFTSPDIAA